MAMNSFNINYPFKDDTSTKGFISMNRVTKDSYSSNLLLLLLTQRGERYYESDYGTNLLKFIFEPNDDLTASGIEEEIKNLVALYIPEVKITSVRFYTLNDEDGNPISENHLNVNVKFVYTEGYLNEQGELNITF
jgi:phage baseplate assembly protein W